MRWLALSVALTAACSAGSPKRVESAPEPPLNLHALVESAEANLVAGDFVLVDQSTDPAVRYPATKLEVAESTGPLQLMILIQGDEVWMGNDTYVGDLDPDFNEGAYRALRIAMNALGHALPADAETTVYKYHYDLELYAGPMAAKALTGEVLGSQESYNSYGGGGFVYLLQRAVSILSDTSSRASEQALIVIGDGMGQEMNARSYIAPMAESLRKEGVRVYTLHYTTNPNSNPDGVDNFAALGISGAYVATTQAAMIENAKAVGTSIGQHNGAYHVTFGVYDPPDDYSAFGVEVRGKLVNGFSFPGLED